MLSVLDHGLLDVVRKNYGVLGALILSQKLSFSISKALKNRNLNTRLANFYDSAPTYSPSDLASIDGGMSL